jgi:hypothetical protein
LGRLEPLCSSLACIESGTLGFLMTLSEGPTPSSGTTMMPPGLQRRNAPGNPWVPRRLEKGMDMSGRLQVRLEGHDRKTVARSPMHFIDERLRPRIATHPSRQSPQDLSPLGAWRSLTRSMAERLERRGQLATNLAGCCDDSAASSALLLFLACVKASRLTAEFSGRARRSCAWLQAFLRPETVGRVHFMRHGPLQRCVRRRCLTNACSLFLISVAIQSSVNNGAIWQYLHLCVPRARGRTEKPRALHLYADEISMPSLQRLSFNNLPHSVRNAGVLHGFERGRPFNAPDDRWLRLPTKLVHPDRNDLDGLNRTITRYWLKGRAIGDGARYPKADSVAASKKHQSRRAN